MPRSFVWHWTQDERKEIKQKSAWEGSPQLLDEGALGQLLKHLTPP